MKRLVIFSSLLTVLAAQPVLAGHGFIEETDTGFYVEFTGDPSDKPAEAPRAVAQAVPLTPAERLRDETNQKKAEARREAEDLKDQYRRRDAEYGYPGSASRPSRKHRQARASENPE